MQKKAPVYNYYYSSQDRGVVKGRTCGEGWTEQVTRYWPVRYAMPCTSHSV